MTRPATRILDSAGGGPILVLEGLALRVIRGPDAPRTFPMHGTHARIGSDSHCEVVLNDPAVSAEHAELFLTEQGVRVRDRDSTNGTWVAGVRLREAWVPVGLGIRLGETELELATTGQDIEIPLSRRTNFGALLGEGPPMRAAFAVLERAAKSDATVLLLGETGTGKELAARALHDASARRDGPFVVVDCGAVTATLVESQLFGHARGAFTGATEARAGAFEEASGGTLVLDELGELPLDLQPKLLRVVESRAVQRVGETKPRAVDVRIVACTNRNLAEEARAGRFRPDLYYRFAVVSVTLPPLRERREEIPRLVDHFRSQLGHEVSAPVPARILRLLSAHDWPGNVRELRNVVERMLVLEDFSPALELGAARTDGGKALWELPYHEAKGACLEDFEQHYLARLLAKHGENISDAARAAGISRQSCYRLMDKYGIRGDR